MKLFECNNTGKKSSFGVYIQTDTVTSDYQNIFYAQQHANQRTLPRFLNNNVSLCVVALILTFFMLLKYGGKP